MKDEAKDLPQVIETTMQVIIALRWAAQRGAALPESLDIASQDVLDRLYAWQRRKGETQFGEGACGREPDPPAGSRPSALRAGHGGRVLL
ncbi:MAG: hypothetical protein AB7I32_03865 [Gammaproteobacteria bacterium]